MNRADKLIAKRIARGGYEDTVAYDPWEDVDRIICGTITTRPYDYTRKGGIVIFEHDKRS